MENRRHGTARVSKTSRSGRSQRDQGEFDRQRGNKSQPDKGSGSGAGYPKKRHFGDKGDKRDSPKKGFTPKDKQKKSWKSEPPKQRIVSDMQITDGKHRGKYLVSSTSPKVKPSPGRIRETLFRVLYRQVNAGRFLDLCAGAGTMGIEAISRGALIGTFVERSGKMCSFIRKNLENFEIKNGHGEVFESEVAPFLKQMSKRRRFWDIVYYNPSYDADYEDDLKYFERGVGIRPGGILVIEHHSEMFFPENIGILKRWKVVVEGESAISFYDRKS